MGVWERIWSRVSGNDSSGESKSSSPSSSPEGETGGATDNRAKLLQQDKLRWEKDRAAFMLDLTALGSQGAPEAASLQAQLNKADGQAADEKYMTAVGLLNGLASSLKALLARYRAPKVETEAAHKAAGLQNPAFARNTSRAKTAAIKAVKPDGTLDLAALGDGSLEDKTIPPSPQSKHLNKLLKQFKDDEKLRTALASIGKPDPQNPAAALIRNTLGLPKDAEVTEAHARQAALSSLLAELRQQDVGSCFGTSIAIKVHDRQPELFLADMKALIETGKFVRTINGKTVEVPISTQMSNGSLEKPLKIKRADGKMTSVSGGALTQSVAIHEAPSVGSALDSLGVAGDQREKAVAVAVASQRQTSAIKAALAKLSPGVTAAAQAALLKEALVALQAAPATTIPVLLQNLVKDRQDLDATQKLAVADGYTEFNNLAEDDITPGDIVRQLVMKKHGLTDADLLLRQEHEALRPKIHALRGDSSPEAAKALEEFSKLDDQLSKKRDKFGALDADLDASKNAYLAQEDNRLLRSWEYTVSSLAEKGLSHHHTANLGSTSTDTVGEEMDKTVTAMKAGKADAQLDGIATKLKAKFKDLFDSRIQAGYDASMQGVLSSDGNSSRGAFTLFDTTGIPDPTKWIRIADNGAYVKMIEGLMMESWFELYDQEGDKDLREKSRDLADRLAEAVQKESFVQEAARKAVAKYPPKVGSTDPNPNKASPWGVVSGSHQNNIVPSYYGKDKTADTTAPFTPTKGDDLAKWVVKSTKDMWATIGADVAKDPEDSAVPMGNGPHAFSLKPGSPALRAAVESGKDPAVWLTEHKAAEKKKKFEAKLTPALKRKLVKSVLSGNDEQSITGWIQGIDLRISQAGIADPTVENFMAAFKASSAPQFADANEASFVSAAIATIKDPVPRADQEKRIAAVLGKLQLAPEQVTGVKEEALKGLPDPAPMAALEKSIDRALNTKSIARTDQNSAAKIFETLDAIPEPLGLAFADSNWGGGDHHTIFSMVANPLTGDMEIWQMNEDGSNAMKMDQDTWVKCPWDIKTNPSEFGGV